MLHAEQKSARKRLDALLREAPDRMMRVLEEGGFAGTLEQLREADAPSPDWVRARAQNMRLKCGCARMRLRELDEELRTALTAWEGGEADGLRAAQAELIRKQIAEKIAEMNSVSRRMSALIAMADSAAEGAEQAELLAALTQLRSFGREAAE